MRQSLPVTTEQIDRPDRGRELPAYEGQTFAKLLGVVGEELLQVLLDAVLLQSRIGAEVVGGIADDLFETMRSVSPPLASTTHSGVPSASVPSVTVHGGDIQFSGL